VTYFDVHTQESQIRKWARQLRAVVVSNRSQVPILALAQARGISRIVEIPLHSDGLLAREGNELVIYLNKQAGVNRQRFTCAHEIGHTYLGNPLLNESSTKGKVGKDKGCYVEFTQQNSVDEYLCDIFAVELLMPREDVESLLNQYGASIKCVQRISSIFGVSLSTAAWRMAELASENLGVIWFKKMGKPNCPEDVRLRVHWGVFPHQQRTYLPRYDSAKADSLVVKSFLSGQVVEGPEKMDIGSVRGLKHLVCKRFYNTVLCLVFENMPTLRVTDHCFKTLPI